MAKKEKPGTKLCKHCKSEIPYDAKVCPQCRKKVKGGMLRWGAIAIAAILILSSMGGSDDAVEGSTGKIGEVEQADTAGSETESAVETEKKDEPAEETEPEEVQTQYHVGDILQDGNMKIVYMASGEYAEENEYLRPEDGYKYIYLQFAFENISDKEDESISIYSFECYADGYAAEMYYGGEDDLSATLSAGRKTTGYIYFSVPENAKIIEIEYETNIFTEEKINFIYEGEKNSGYTPELSAEPSEGAYAVGEVAESSNLRITYCSCEEYVGDNDLIQPKNGFRFVSCEFEFENLGASDEYISCYDFDCYADGMNCAASYYRDDLLSAALSAGRKTVGTVTFEVPEDAEVVEVEYLSNYWTSNRVVFTVK